MRALRQDDPAFPRELLLVEKPPEVLYAQGDLSLLTRPKVAIIGSRHPSPYGIRAAYGVYLLAEREIWAPRSDSAECAGLAYAATGPEAFAGLVDAVVRSNRIAAMLGRGAP